MEPKRLHLRASLPLELIDMAFLIVLITTHYQKWICDGNTATLETRAFLCSNTWSANILHPLDVPANKYICRKFANNEMPTF